MSRQIILAFTCVVGLGVACVVGLWWVTRGPSGAPSLSQDQIAGPGGGPVGATRRPAQAAVTATAATLASAPAVVLVPLFDTNAVLERGRATTLRFRAEREAPGGPTTSLELSLTSIHVPERLEAQLTVREIGQSEYEAEFLAHEGGQYLLRVTTGAARTSVPIILRVSATAAETVPTLVAHGVGSVSRARQRAWGGAGRRGR